MQKSFKGVQQHGHQVAPMDHMGSPQACSQNSTILRVKFNFNQPC